LKSTGLGIEGEVQMMVTVNHLIVPAVDDPNGHNPELLPRTGEEG
jgi:hypothetical protein